MSFHTDAEAPTDCLTQKGFCAAFNSHWIQDFACEWIKAFRASVKSSRPNIHQIRMIFALEQWSEPQAMKHWELIYRYFLCDIFNELYWLKQKCSNSQFYQFLLPTKDKAAETAKFI